MTPVEYMLGCAAVMVTCLTILVGAGCLFGIFLLCMWGAGIVTNFRAGLRPPEEQEITYTTPQTRRFPGDRSFNGQGE